MERRRKAVWITLLLLAGLYGVGIAGWWVTRVKGPDPSADPALSPAASVAVIPLSAVDSHEIERTIKAWKSSEAALLTAQNLGERGLYERAIQRLGSALQENPAHLAVKLELARLHLCLNQAGQAEPYLLEVVSAQPGNREARLLLAESLEATGRFEQAVALSEWVLGLEPNSVKALEVLTKSHTALNQPGPAAASLKRLTALNPGYMVPVKDPAQGKDPADTL